MTWLWDLATGREVGRFEGGKSPEFVFARFQPNGDTLVIASKSGVELLRAPTWAEIATAEIAEAHLRQPANRERNRSKAVGPMSLLQRRDAWEESTKPGTSLVCGRGRNGSSSRL